MNPSVLLIDDEEIILISLSHDLKNQGYEVTTANNGPEGIRKIRKNCFDMVITDLKMEGTDGIQVIEETKKIDPKIPVLILTGHGSLSSAIKALRLGASDYLLKPCDRGELAMRVANCLEKRDLQSIVEKRNEELKRANEQLKREISDRKRIANELQESRGRLIEMNKHLKRLSNLDGLTGIPNRRHFDEFLAREWNRSVRQGTPFSLIMTDIDFFKLYNDNYGHQAGDECLKKVARVMAKTLNRPGDLAARYGGEEFAVILTDTDRQGAALLAETLRANVESLKIPHAFSSTSKHVTISLGVGTLFPQRGSSPEKLVSLADKALYEAKQEGRNRVIISEDQSR